MKKKDKRRSKQPAKGRELSDAELEQTVGGVTLQEAPVAPVSAEALALQEATQMESRRFQTLSNASKARHDIALNAIKNMK